VTDHATVSSSPALMSAVPSAVAVVAAVAKSVESATHPQVTEAAGSVA
jgi:hypothetical protein